MDIIYIILWFVLLIWWANYMVNWAWSLAKRFGISDIVIWLTVIAFWTSAPELVTSMMSAFNGNADLAISNVIGSNISNLLLILWATALVYPLKAPSNTFYKEIPFMLAASILFVLLVIFEPEQTITRPDAWVLIMFFCIFLYYIFRQANKWKKEDKKDDDKKKKKTKNKDSNEDSIKEYTPWISLIMTIGWLIALVYGGKLIVDWAVWIAQSFGLPNSFIGITIIAIWTSLPELASSIAAAMKKKTDMAIGWIIWSNIFNSLWILWATWSLLPLKAYSWVEFDAYFNIFITIVILILLFPRKWKMLINKREGLLLLLMYFSYIWYAVYKVM